MFGLVPGNYRGLSGQADYFQIKSTSCQQVVRVVSCYGGNWQRCLREPRDDATVESLRARHLVSRANSNSELPFLWKISIPQGVLLTQRGKYNVDCAEIQNSGIKKFQNCTKRG